MGEFVTTSVERLLAEVQSLRSELKAVQSSPAKIPIRDTDPPVDLGIPVWMLIDGRIRARKPDGTVIEVATTTPGSSSSTQAAPAPAYTPSSLVYERTADWQQAYRLGGTVQYNYIAGRMYYGWYSSTNGEYKSMAHFPNLTELAPGPAGSRIAKVELTISNPHTYPDVGTTLKIGLHNSATAPAAFAETEWTPFTVQVGKPSTLTYELPTWVGDRLRDGTAQGITLNQRSTSRSLYGYADSVKLRIEHVK